MASTPTPEAAAAEAPTAQAAAQAAAQPAPPALKSVCLFCGSSNMADPVYLDAAARFGRATAAAGLRLVYGGGGVGLMGAAARAAHEAGGDVLGVMPSFLRTREILFDDVETRVVETMHQRKAIFLEESDAFAIFPGGVGTLEEVVELLSWRRLDLHHKPIVFLNLRGYWDTFFTMVRHTIDQNFTPPAFSEAYGVVDTPEEVLPALMQRLARDGARMDTRAPALT